MNHDRSPNSARGRTVTAFASGSVIGALGGLIGLGGAEFRLPLLIGLFGLAPLEAVIMNKAMSLVVVASALPFRMAAIPIGEVASHWAVIVNLLAGSLAGAWFGAGWAIRLKSESLYQIIAALLVVIAVVLLVGPANGLEGPQINGPLLIGVGIVAGFAIGVVASLLGVAGGELLIPTIVLLFGADIKLAGSLSLAVSLPTMLIASVAIVAIEASRYSAGTRSFWPRWLSAQLSEAILVLAFSVWCQPTCCCRCFRQFC